MDKVCPICHELFFLEYRLDKNNKQVIVTDKKYCDMCEGEGTRKDYFEYMAKTASGLGRFIIFARDKFRCVYCGRSSIYDGVVLHVDHIFPQNRGGDNQPDNLVTACSECNVSKNDRVLRKEQIFELWDVVKKRNEGLDMTYDELLKEFNKCWH